jgi:RHS repeat-associated protein
MDRGYDFHAGNGTAASGTDNGNVFGITNYRDANRSQAFTYDALNRLTSAWSSANTGNYSWGETYSIDAWGNLQISPMSNKAHGGNFTLSGNAQNRPTGLAYDAAGNLMSYLSATYTYDQENRLFSTAGTAYTYDGNGERVLKSNSSTGAPSKYYWSMGGNTLAEAGGSGNLTAEYIYFGGKRVARIDLPTNTVHYYLSDHLGSTSLVASSAGTVEEESDYYPFGTEVMVTGPGVNELKFTGKRRDSESQLDYFAARYYLSSVGKMMTPDWSAKTDPIPYVRLDDPQSLNLYAYVRNNALSKADLDGHCFWCKKTLVKVLELGQGIACECQNVDTNSGTAKTVQKIYQTYTKKNPDTGQIYSGKTSGKGTPEENLAKRDAGHHMNNKGYGPPQLDQSSSNPDAITGREQQLIEVNGGAQSQGGTSGNAINAVSPKNPLKETFIQAAEKEFGAIAKQVEEVAKTVEEMPK